MPRLYTKDVNDDPDVMSFILDFCEDCWHGREVLVEDEHDGQCDPPADDNKGAEHPPYEEEEYICCECGSSLGEIDN